MPMPMITERLRHSALSVRIDMDHLWSPWRLAYITGERDATGCVFCNAPRRDEHGGLADRLSRPDLLRHPQSYPYNNGHLMVVPNRHIASLAAATRRRARRADRADAAVGDRA